MNKNSNFISKKNNKKKESIQNRMEDNLLASKFRILNEKLYTTSSKEAYDYFTTNPEDYEIYHQGFSIQANKWPINPNNILLKELKKEKYNNKVIADMGCGEAFLAQELTKNNLNKIYSFDLVEYNEHITKCDIANTPLNNSEVDICVFCLSLMGNNFIDFVKEARRILKNKGILFVCEITSRIVNFDNFVNIFTRLGFSLRKKFNLKDYFVLLIFDLEKEAENQKDIHIEKKKKSNNLNDSNNDNNSTINSHEILKPCLYKKR